MSEGRSVGPRASAPAPGHPGIRVIAAVNAASAALTLVFWTLGYLRLFAGGEPLAPAARASAAATLGFLVADLVWALPLLIASVPGLWRRREGGWLCAQMANVLWLYSMTAVWVRDGYAGSLSPGGVWFAPFALFAAWATIYLWRVRRVFWAQG
jgi:hypothetical protein